MSTHLPPAVHEGLRAARKAALYRNDRLCIHDGEEVYRIARFWADGLSVDADYADKLRGRVDIYDGARHLFQCLLEGGRVEGEECIFDFKWLNAVTDRPAVDFERARPAPVALIGR